MPLDLPRVQAVCFDVDGTLSDTDDQFVLKLASWLQPLRYLFPHKDVHPAARKLVMLTEGPGNWLYSLADRFGLGGKVVAIGNHFYEKGIGEAEEPFRLIEGVKDLLRVLSKLYPLSIVSTRGQRSIYRFLFQFELLPFFTAIASGQTCEHTKPYPDPILWAAERMGVPVESCLMVGDTVVDIQAGQRAGAQTVGVLCGFGDEDELRRAGADLIMKCTSDLKAIIQGDGSIFDL